jgi:hypothetical protein
MNIIQATRDIELQSINFSGRTCLCVCVVIPALPAHPFQKMFSLSSTQCLNGLPLEIYKGDVIHAVAHELPCRHVFHLDGEVKVLTSEN